MDHFNYEIVRKDFHDVLNEIDGKLKAEWSEKYKDIAGGKEIISTFIGTSKVLYKTIIFLCIDSKDDSERDLYYVLSTPQLNRTLLEILFSVIYLLEDFPTHNKLFFKYLLVDKKEKLDALKKNYAGIDKWDNYLKEQYEELEKFKQVIEDNLSLTDHEETKLGKNIIQSGRFPSPSRVIKRLKDSHSDKVKFLEFLDSLLYMELSSKTHLNPSGVIDLSKFYLKDNIFFNENSKKTNESELLSFRQEQVCISFGLMLALYSEIEINFDYGFKSKLKNLWMQFNDIGNDFIKEIYEKRYCAILA